MLSSLRQNLFRALPVYVFVRQVLPKMLKSSTANRPQDRKAKSKSKREEARSPSALGVCGIVDHKLPSSRRSPFLERHRHQDNGESQGYR